MPSHLRCLLRQAKQAAGTDGGGGGCEPLPSLLPGGPPGVVVEGPSLNCVGELLLLVAEDIADPFSGEKESILGG